MRRSAGFCFWLVVILLAIGTGCLAVQDPEPIPVEPEESAAPVPEEDTEAQDPELAPVEPDAGDDTATTADTAPDWQSELDQISDLLIDGKPLEARGKADHLLQVENLPEDVASRGRALREKADEKLAGSPLAGSEPRPEPRPKIEIPAKEESSEKSEKTATAAKEQSFKVRVAAIGSGFSQGVTGLLRISDTGISFSPQGKGGEKWTIRWQNLAEAKSDTGLWDAPYPLVLIERGGRKRYVARLDQKGSYVTGTPLLSAIAEGRRAQKSSQKKSSEPEEGK